LLLDMYERVNWSVLSRIAFAFRSELGYAAAASKAI